MKNDRGFTLLEVIIALVILAIALTALISTLSNTTNRLSYIRDKTVAHWVANNQLNLMQLKLQKIPTPSNPSIGTSIMCRGQWHWEAKLDTINNQTARVIITVSDSSSKKIDSLVGFIRIANHESK